MGCDTLIGNLSLSLWAPVLFMQEKTRLESNVPPGSEWQWRLARVRVGLRSEPYTFWQLCRQFFSHGPMLDHKALVAPDPTYSGSLSCKSLLASHCAVSQTTVSSDDCAINTSMNGCYPYVASIYVRLSNVTIHPYLHCGGNWFLLLFIAVIKHHP